MKKKVAVILSGCGFQDGAEIYETTLTLLRLDQLNIAYRCFAPDIDQHHVINHLTGDVAEGETRNVLVESARLARGEIDALDTLDPEQFSAVILPGGFGAAKNLCDFALKGAEMTILDTLVEKVQGFYADKKPIGLMCIAPVMVPHMIDAGIPVTIGQDASISGAVSAMGGLHKSCTVSEVVIDREHKVVTTPAYMLAGRISEAAFGIFKLVDKIDEMMAS
ncbi:isoprenoid biosynthesis glyoxalase ElbB [Phytohalomonas tamaricis]|uniref:isoprenoid biosynthesis glyoxalase ElbB n=1 Tax=Phytohalomonas tamaricis TaxID=2081032 RepID=UPI000D0B7840|nr:isoprenoid biosynthesis glyoxalase ElbB [Phytohalomonas tamaricis]